LKLAGMPTLRRRRHVASPGDRHTVIGYIRVSTAGQATSGVGLDAQRHAITDYAARNGLTIVEWQEDAGISGAGMSNRPGLLAALAGIETGRAGGLVVAKVDRLGRSTHDVSGIVERAQREGWRVIAVDVGLDTATPSGEMVATCLAMAARFEWHRISERQREKFAALRRAGRRRGRVAAPRELADRLIAERASARTFRAIADSLNREAVPTIRGGSRWFPATVLAVVVTRRRELAASTDSSGE
jgi:DNA invertase Pin-like site-specific DNA recombinase